ncbi:hypothetical protein ON010_g9284 [Phytophthora cinnamomi]|nr:hypothetical protein ON010_g9284 [Phytophthora cinnamomi]
MTVVGAHRPPPEASGVDRGQQCDAYCSRAALCHQQSCDQEDDNIGMVCTAYRRALMDKHSSTVNGFRECGIWPLSMVQLKARLALYKGGGVKGEIGTADWLKHRESVIDKVRTAILLLPPVPVTGRRGSARLWTLPVFGGTCIVRGTDHDFVSNASERRLLLSHIVGKAWEMVGSDSIISGFRKANPILILSGRSLARSVTAGIARTQLPRFIRLSSRAMASCGEDSDDSDLDLGHTRVASNTATLAYGEVCQGRFEAKNDAMVFADKNQRAKYRTDRNSTSTHRKTYTPLFDAR